MYLPGLAFADVGVSGREQLCDFEVEKVNVEGEGYQGDDYKVLILWSQRRDSNPRPPVYENGASLFHYVFASAHLLTSLALLLVSLFLGLLMFFSNRNE